MTGTRLKGAEVVQVGLADYFVKSENLKPLQEEILKTTNANTTVEDLRAIVKKYEVPVERKYKNEEFINKVFGKGSVEEIYKALRETNENKEFAQYLIKELDLQSPNSLKVIHELLKRGKDLDIKENFILDFRLIERLLLFTLEGLI